MPVEDPGWQALDPPQRRQRMLDAVKRLLLRESQAQPLLVVFEDLHWVDGETQALLDTLVESLGSARLLLLVTYRPEYQHGWSGRTAYSQMRLDALAAESASELLGALLGDESGLAPLKHLLVKRGNPFFLEETVRMLVETGALEGSRGRYRLTQPLQALQVPPTVQSILAARIDRLSSEDKHLLQTASVVGKDVPFALLQAIAELPDDALRGGLDRLRTAELLYQTHLFPDVEYTFTHALTHDVTYRSVLRERRRELHARTVEAIERRHATGLAEHVERLVDHAVRGEVWDKAAAYGVRAGTRALDRSADAPTAQAFFEVALQALGHLPERRETLEQALEVRFLMSNPLFALGASEAYLSRAAEAVAIADRLGADEHLARALGVQTLAFWFVGENALGLESGDRAMTIAEGIGHSVHRVHAYMNLGFVSRTVGDYHRAVRLFAAIVDLLPVGGELERLGRVIYPVVNARNELAGAYAELGEFDRAATIHEEALRIAEDIGHVATSLVTRLDAGQLLVRRGAFAAAIPRLEAVNEALRDAGLLLWRIRGLANHGHALTMTGRVADGIALLCDAVEQTASRRPSDEARCATYLSAAYLRAGRTAEARELAERTLALSLRRSERSTEALIRHVLGEIEAETPHGGDLAAAGSHYSAGMSLAEGLGMRPLVAHCHLGLGKLSWRTGQRDQAREHLTTATTRYREMGMTYWLLEAEGILREFGTSP